ncbi:MAG: IS21-like element helper ATPase IstB [Bacteroidetes bacterium]|nr:IS21-like element helper ATPase IstB [Bacteroidota bacterium]
MHNIESLPLLLKELRLSAFIEHWETEQEIALDKQLIPGQFLTNLCHLEVKARYERRVRSMLREAKLPSGKSFESLNFNEFKGIKKAQVNKFQVETSWIERAENLLLFGPSGAGKTHIASAIGYALIEKGIRVKFTAATELVQSLQRAKQELTLFNALAKLDRYPLLIVDDIGYVKKDEQETQVLFELIAHRYEARSMIITSNQPFSEWDKIFGDNMMTVAAIDRLVHHATVLDFKREESYRRKQAVKRKSAQRA